MSDKSTKLSKKKISKKVVRKSGLGRGLDALLGQRIQESGSADIDANELQNLGIEQLQPGQYQPRSVMDQTKLQELADSITAQGIVQPIVVRKLTSKTVRGASIGQTSD